MKSILISDRIYLVIKEIKPIIANRPWFNGHNYKFYLCFGLDFGIFIARFDNEKNKIDMCYNYQFYKNEFK